MQPPLIHTNTPKNHVHFFLKLQIIYLNIMHAHYVRIWEVNLKCDLFPSLRRKFPFHFVLYSCYTGHISSYFSHRHQGVAGLPLHTFFYQTMLLPLCSQIQIPVVYWSESRLKTFIFGQEGQREKEGRSGKVSLWVNHWIDPILK